MATTYLDPLAARYATQEAVRLWEPAHLQHVERVYWLAVLTAQLQHGGFPLTALDVEAYRQTLDQVTPELVEQYERVTHHQTKAHLEAWNSLAHREKLHLGLTSADVVATRDHLLLGAASGLAYQRCVTVLHLLADLAERHRDDLTTARTHHQPAQVTTLGRRYASWAEQLQLTLGSGFPALPLRGTVGAVGTATDLLALVHPGPHPQAHPDLAQLELSGLVGVPGLVAPNQTYPHLLEGELWARYRQVAQLCNSVAVTHRLEAGRGLWHEEPTTGQTGSSALPHKTNPRYSEQVESLAAVVQGYLHTADLTNQATWYEGDVSHSAARRVYLPGVHLALDGLLNTFAWTLVRGRHDTAGHLAEVETHRRQLNSSRYLALLVAEGWPREVAHSKARDELFHVEQNQLPGWETGAAQHQTDTVVKRVRDWYTVDDSLSWHQPL